MMTFFKNERIFFYIFLDLFISFLISCILFLFILLMFDLIQLIEFFLIYEVSFLTILEMVKDLIFKATPFMLPISSVLASLTTYSKLSLKNEVIAFSSLGFRKKDLLSPAIVLGFLTMWLHFQFNLYLSPLAEVNLQQTKEEIRISKMSTLIQKGIFIKNFENLTIYVEDSDSKKNKIENIFIKDERESGDSITVLAKSGEFIKLKNQTIPLLKLYKGSFHRIQNSNYMKAHFDSYEMNLLFHSQKESKKNLNTYTYRQLKSKLKKTNKLLEKQKWRSLIQERFALPFSCLLLALLGSLIGIRNNSKTGYNPLTLALSLTAGYWILHVLSTGASQKQVLLPSGIFSWIANSILIVLIFKMSSKRVA